MAMKEYEMAAVSEGQDDDGYFGGDAAIGTNGNGVDAGQLTLFDAGGLRSDQEMGGSGPDPAEHGRPVWCGCFSIRFYQKFFDVDTADVIDRWLHSVLSCKREKEFLELITDKPDAYGPFWNATTLVFLIALSANLKTGVYDVSTLVTSTWVVYGFAVVAPVILWLLLNQLDISLSLIQAVCTYGYSLGPFLPAVLLCAIPLPYMSVGALSAACIASVIFLLRTLTPMLLEKNMGLAAPIMAGMGVFQAVLALVLEFAFFN